MIVELKKYPGYFVDETGKVYSARNESLKEKRLYLDKTGYLYVTFYCNGAYYRPRVHKLVAEAFIPNPDNKPYVNHLNEIKSDNRVSNLEWCTPSENLLYGNARYNLNKSISDPSRPRSNNKSGRKGVWETPSHTWRASFDRKYLGTFKTFAEAVAVREKAEKEAYNF